MNQKRECIVFNAPNDLKTKLNQYAKEHLTHTSVICRQAVQSFLDKHATDMTPSNAGR